MTDGLSGISLPIPDGWYGQEGQVGAQIMSEDTWYDCPGDASSTCTKGGAYSAPARALGTRGSTAEAVAKAEISANAEESYGGDSYGRIGSHEVLESKAVTVAGQKGYLVRWKAVTSRGSDGYVQSLAFPSPAQPEQMVVVRFGLDTDQKQSVLDDITRGIKKAESSGRGNGRTAEPAARRPPRRADGRVGFPPLKGSPTRPVVRPPPSPRCGAVGSPPGHPGTAALVSFEAECRQYGGLHEPEQIVRVRVPPLQEGPHPQHAEDQGRDVRQRRVLRGDLTTFDPAPQDRLQRDDLRFDQRFAQRLGGSGSCVTACPSACNNEVSFADHAPALRAASRRSPARVPVSMPAKRACPLERRAAATNRGLVCHCRYSVDLLRGARAATPSMVTAS
ncbi:hypothetical protein SHIRM173S_12360 [Streptomyces hirsutus]